MAQMVAAARYNREYSPPMSIPWLYSRYLGLLGITHPVSGMEGLQEIVRRHLCRIPYENVSKLLLFGREGKGRVSTLSDFLDGIERYDLGGTCYTTNPFLASLLAVLGYDADLRGADMSRPNVHTVIRVRVGSVDYHVDVGFAAPFREPIPLDRLPYEIRHGSRRYVLERGRLPQEYVMFVYSGVHPQHGYTVHSPSRPFDFFRQAILESYEPSGFYMNCLRITRVFEAHTVELKNRTLIYYKGSETHCTELKSLSEVQSAVENDLAMPRCPVYEAIAVLERVTQTRFFDMDSTPTL